MARVLLVRVQSLGGNPTEDVADVSFGVQVANGSEVEVDTTYDTTINLKALGVYRTPVQLNQACLTAVRNFLLDTYSIATNAYAAEFFFGGSDSLGL